MLFTKGAQYTISEQVYTVLHVIKKKKKKIHDLRKIMKRKE